MYGKTFTSLWEGSMVGRPTEQLVFIFLFCHCDRGGFVEAHPAVVAAKTGLALEAVEGALKALQEPDPNSRSKAEEGRRIVRIDDDHIFGWQVVNYEYYRGLRRADDLRAYHRAYWHKRKERLKSSQPHSNTLKRTQAIADADAEAEAVKTTAPSEPTLSRKPPFKIPTEKEVSIYCSGKGIVLDAAQFCDFYASKGWKVGNQPMKDWQAAVRTWEKRHRQERAGKPKGVTAEAMLAFAETLPEGR